MKKINRKKLWTLFTSTFFISAFTIGGGAVIVPLMQKKFVEDLKWIDEKEMLDMVAIAQACPGVMAVNTSIILGYRISGILGTIVATLATVLPPLIIISLVSLVYKALEENQIARFILTGMQAGVVAFMANLVYTMAFKICKAKKLIYIILMIVALLMLIIFKVNALLVILFCGLVGLFASLDKKKNIF